MIYSPSLPPASTGWAITHWRLAWWTPRLISPAACSRRHYSQSLIWQQRAARLIRSRRRLTVFSATGGVAALLLITGWHHYYNGNYQSGITVLKQAKAFMDVPPPQGKMTLATCNCRF